MSKRYTFYTVAKLGPKRSLTPEGFLLCEDVPLARLGMMVYGPDEAPIEPGPEGIVKIFREAEDVFTDATIGSAQGKPVTNNHPDDDVTPETWKQLAIGVMLNVRRGLGIEDDLLLGDLLITDAEGIYEIQENGKVEISLGYDADYEETGPGMGKQKNIIINHGALVGSGRCGSRCSIADHKHFAKDNTMAAPSSKKGKIAAFIARAIASRDSAEELEKITDEAAEELGGADTHIHIHGQDSDPDEKEKKTDDEDPDDKKKKTDDEDPDDGEKKTEDEDPDDDGKTKDDEDRWAKNDAEHAELWAAIKALQGGTSDEETVTEEMKDEFPDDVKAEASKAKDSAYFGDSFQETVAQAEILVPGIRIPTYDRAAKPKATYDSICNLRRQALDLAYAQPATRGILDDLLAGKTFDLKGMNNRAIASLFKSASSVARAANNKGRSLDTNKDQNAKGAPKPVTSLADLNRLNREKFAADGQQ